MLQGRAGPGTYDKENCKLLTCDWTAAVRVKIRLRVRFIFMLKALFYSQKDSRDKAVLLSLPAVWWLIRLSAEISVGSPLWFTSLPLFIGNMWHYYMCQLHAAGRLGQTLVQSVDELCQSFWSVTEVGVRWIDDSLMSELRVLGNVGSSAFGAWPILGIKS